SRVGPRDIVLSGKPIDLVRAPENLWEGPAIALIAGKEAPEDRRHHLTPNSPDDVIFEVTEAIWAEYESPCMDDRFTRSPCDFLAAAVDSVQLSNVSKLPGIQHTKPPNGFSGRDQLLSCLEPEQPAERIAKKIIRSMRPNRPNARDELNGHLLETKRCWPIASECL